MQRYDSYLETKKNNISEKIINFSLDDFFDVFIDLNYHDYTSIFDNPTLSYLYYLHLKFGVKVTCYVFYEKGEFNLSKVTSKYRNQFIQNNGWLKFGFHQFNSDSFDKTSGKLLPFYNQTMRQLIRIVGYSSVDPVIRMDRFFGTYRDVKAMTIAFPVSIQGLLTSDDRRRSYYLNDYQNNYIFCHDYYYDKNLKINLYSTDLRIEMINDIASKVDELSSDSWNNQRNLLVVFTHERMLKEQNIRSKLEYFFKTMRNSNYSFSFLESIKLD